MGHHKLINIFVFIHRVLCMKHCVIQLPNNLQECPYPDLFSTVYQQCLDFQSVDCEDRHEVQAPCEYANIKSHQPV